MSYLTPRKNQPYVFVVGLVSQSDTNLLQVNPTIEAGDVQVSLDGGSLSNITTLPTASGSMVTVSLTDAEMNGDNVTVVFADQSGSQWADQLINLQTTSRQIDDLAFPQVSGRGIDVDTDGAVATQSTSSTSSSSSGTFTYNFTTAPLVSYVRLLISDTQAPGIFSDEEIAAFYNIQAAQFQSSMFYSYPAGQNLPSSPVSYLRVAALALDSMSTNLSRVSSVLQVLDVKLNPNASDQMRKDAANYRQVDDEAGAFAIIEQCTTVWGFSDRYWNQVQRQSGGYFG